MSASTFICLYLPPHLPLPLVPPLISYSLASLLPLSPTSHRLYNSPMPIFMGPLTRLSHGLIIVSRGLSAARAGVTFGGGGAGQGMPPRFTAIMDGGAMSGEVTIWGTTQPDKRPFLRVGPSLYKAMDHTADQQKGGSTGDGRGGSTTDAFLMTTPRGGGTPMHRHARPIQSFDIRTGVTVSAHTYMHANTGQKKRGRSLLQADAEASSVAKTSSDEPLDPGKSGQVAIEAGGASAVSSKAESPSLRQELSTPPTPGAANAAGGASVSPPSVGELELPATPDLTTAGAVEVAAPLASVLRRIVESAESGASAPSPGWLPPLPPSQALNLAHLLPLNISLLAHFGVAVVLSMHG